MSTKHEIIARFLERTGQYVTNDASREAAITQAVTAERPMCAPNAKNPFKSPSVDGSKKGL